MRARAAAIWLAIIAAAMAGGCGQKNARNAARTPAGAGAGAAVAERPGWMMSGDPGLEVVLWSTQADEGTFARAIAPYASAGGAPGGLSPESRALLATHGLRVLEVPVSELDALRVALGAPPRHVNQWLGQALAWTEAATGPEQPRGQTIALDAERLRLGPGRLRLLARSWISPVPGAAGGGPAGAMTIELLPQHDEKGRPAGAPSLLAPTSISAADEGLLFTRLLTRMTVRSSDVALVIVGMPPGVEIEELARRAPAVEETRAITDGEAGAAPGVGQVVRQPAGGQGPGVGYETTPPGTTGNGFVAGPAGPPVVRAPTLGEAIFSPPVWVTPRRSETGAQADAEQGPVQTTPRRLVVALVPKLPASVRLLP